MQELGGGFMINANNDEINIYPLKQEDTGYHTHDFLELVYVTRGKGIHCWDDKSTVVKEGDYFIIDYQSWHKYKVFDNSDFEIINCLFMPEFIDLNLKNCRNFKEILGNYLIRFDRAVFNTNPTAYVYKDTTGKIREILYQMIEEFQKKQQGYTEILRCKLIEIIISTMRCVTVNDEYIDSDIDFTVDYIGKNYMLNPSLFEISKKLGLTLPYLSVKFKNQMGMTFTEYLQKVRIGNSLRLLSSTDKKVFEIAEIVGYKDIKCFYRIFKKYMGKSPGEFRKEIKS